MQHAYFAALPPARAGWPTPFRTGRLLTLLLAWLLPALTLAQAITGFTPTSGPIGTPVTITGSGFNATAGQNVVFFGATQAAVTAASATSLTATVPLGTTYQYPTVTNLATALTAYAAQPFVVTLNGAVAFAAKADFATGAVPNSVAIGDVDGDGRPDLAVANSGSNTVSVLRQLPPPPPAITGFTPTSGPVGTPVTITGTILGSATAITFSGSSGNVVTTGFTINATGTQISGVVVPAGATTGTFTVTTTSGTSAASSQSFTVVPPPTLTAVSPTPGGLGQRITLTGTNLSSPTALTINGAKALGNIISNTGNVLVVRVPVTAAASGNVVLTTANGTATAPFTVMPPPGNALAFDGVDDELTTAATAPAFGTGSLTLEAWVRTNDATPGGVFVAVGSVGGNNDYWLGMNNRRAAVSISGGAAVGTSFINDGRWHHLAGVRNGMQLTIYVDGVAQNTVTNANAASPAAPLSIGSFGGSYFWPGSLDEVRLWNRAQVPTLASRTAPALGTEPGLALYYNFDQGTPATASTGNNAAYTTLYDLSPNATPATLTNFALTSGNTTSNYVPSYALVVPVLTTSTVRTATGFTVNWLAPAIGTATSYLLDVSTTADFASPIAGSPFATTATSYPLTSLNPSSAYFYRVRALNSALTQPDQGAFSNTVSQATPLPVELTQFTATAEGRTAVRLAWATASEKNSHAFAVERSTDGRTFAPIGTVAAAGSSSSSARTYELLDGQLPADATQFYYRLQQVDNDGSFTYSPVRVVMKGAAEGLALYPNPATTRATLTGALPGTTVTVFDALGRAVTSAPADASGMATLALPAGLPAGVYVVRAGSKALRLTVE